MKKKLKEVRGELLIEVLVAILIGALSVSMLFGAVMVSARMEKTAREKDELFYERLDKAEARDTASALSTGSVTIELKKTDGTVDSSTDVPVNFYGGEGALSYALETP